MSEAPVPTLRDLLRAYERSLIAKVQLSEYLSWGTGIIASFKANVAEHEAMEKAYLADLVERRRIA